MGGNALITVETRRYDRDEYFELEAEVLLKLRAALPTCRVEAIEAYHTKPSFGDMDIIVENKNNAKKILNRKLSEWKIKEIVKNRDCWSIAYGDFQVDLIFMEEEYFSSTLNYFSFNDIGNLLGRVSRQYGFKLGHRGLNYVLMRKTSLLKDINVTNDYMQALEFIGYDSERYKQGFETLEDMFEFVINNSHFDPDIFLLENRNYVARTRDSQRKNYSAFLKYIKDKEFPLNLIADKEKELERGFDTFKGFKLKHDAVFEKLRIKSIIKKKFNGKIILEITGYKGTDLGLFYHFMIKQIQNEGDTDEFFLEKEELEIREFISDVKLELETNGSSYRNFYDIEVARKIVMEELGIVKGSKVEIKLSDLFSTRELMKIAKETRSPIAVTNECEIVFNVDTYNFAIKDVLGIDYSFVKLSKSKIIKEEIAKYDTISDLNGIDDFIEDLSNIKKYSIEKKAIKLSRSKNGEALNSLVIKERTGRFICVDIEQYEKNSDVITEVGFSVFENNTVTVKHYIVTENAELKNGEFVPDNMLKFNFGESEHKSLDEICEIVLQEIELSDYLVGHAIRSDIIALFGSRVVSKLKPVVVDTSTLPKYVDKSEVEGVGLGRLANQLGVFTSNLHNAGNDAYYNMILLLKIIEVYDEQLINK